MSSDSFCLITSHLVMDCHIYSNKYPRLEILHKGVGEFQRWCGTFNRGSIILILLHIHLITYSWRQNVPSSRKRCVTQGQFLISILNSLIQALLSRHNPGVFKLFSWRPKSQHQNLPRPNANKNVNSLCFTVTEFIEVWSYFTYFGPRSAKWFHCGWFTMVSLFYYFYLGGHGKASDPNLKPVRP